MLKVNEYFDGKAKSISFQTSTLPATVGVISPGEYEFGTSKKETMTVISGALTVLLPGMEEWMTYGAGESFDAAYSFWRDFFEAVTLDKLDALAAQYAIAAPSTTASATWV